MPKGSEEQAGKRDDEFTENVIAGKRLIDAGTANDDNLTTGIGAARIIKATNGQLTPEMAKALHLDKLPRSDD